MKAVNIFLWIFMKPFIPVNYQSIYLNEYLNMEKYLLCLIFKKKNKYFFLAAKTEQCLLFKMFKPSLPIFLCSIFVFKHKAMLKSSHFCSELSLTKNFSMTSFFFFSLILSFHLKH